MPFLIHPVAGTILGLIIGSFLAAIISRWPQDRSVVTGRSQCDHCGRKLRAFELVPVFSFLLQSGKCRTCGASIGLASLAVELTAGMMGGLCLFLFPGIEGLIGAIFGWQLLTLAVLDARHQWLPDKLTICLIVSGLLASFVLEDPAIADRLLGGAAGFVSLYLVARIYFAVRGREGLGDGDPKLLAGIGCWLGWSALPLVVLAAAILGLFVVLTMRLRGQAVGASTALPFGSFLAAAAFPIWLANSIVPVQSLLAQIVP